MGLDVYLYWYEDLEAATHIEESVESLEEEIWEESLGELDKDNATQLTEEERDEIHAKIKELRAKMVPESLKKEIDFPSAKYPDHLFRVGYFRSSYNPGGINNVLRSLIGRDLYYIFGVDGNHEYHVKPDWTESLARAKEVRDELIATLERINGFYVDEVSFNMFVAKESLPKSGKDVLDAFLKSHGTDRPFGGDAYSNRDGDFFPRGKMIFAAIPMVSPVGAPAVGLVCKDENGGRYSSYLESMDIVIETIELVLAKEDPQNYVLHWSA